MPKISYNSVVEELLVFLRNRLTDPASPVRGTDTSDSFNGDGNNKTFTLTKQWAKNVISVTVGGTALTYGTDYTVSYDATTVVTTSSAPSVGVNNVVIAYHYGSTWIYPDMPRRDLGLGSMPRISITDLGSTITKLGLGSGSNQTTLRFAITAYAADDTTVREVMNDVKDLIIDYKMSFYNFGLIEPIATTPIMNASMDKTECVQQTIDVEVPFIFEW